MYLQDVCVLYVLYLQFFSVSWALYLQFFYVFWALYVQFVYDPGPQFPIIHNLDSGTLMIYTIYFRAI